MFQVIYMQVTYINSLKITAFYSCFYIEYGKRAVAIKRPLDLIFIVICRALITEKKKN